MLLGDAGGEWWGGVQSSVVRLDILEIGTKW